MRIAIVTIGTRGDIQPFLALALALEQIGYTVTIVTTVDYEPLVKRYGLHLWPIQVDFQRCFQTEAGRAVMDPGYNLIHSLRQLNQIAQAIIEPCLRDSWAACQQAEAVIYGASAVLLTMAHIEPLLNIPCLRARMQPAFHPTGAFPPPTVPAIASMSNTSWPVRVYNRSMYRLLEQLFWQPLRAKINAWRAEQLNLPPLPLLGPYQTYQQQRLPSLHAYSSRLFHRPVDWPDWQHVTGFWFLDAPPDWQPPSDLLDFLTAGPPPVVVSFGSTLFRQGHDIGSIIVQAIAQTKQRAIFLSGWGGLPQKQLADAIFNSQSIPYDWLFPRVKAVIHHGGAGTAAAALRAGIPSITIPVFADHPFWARRLADLGLATAPIPRTRLTVARLVAAIETAIQNRVLHDNVARFKSIIRAEAGLGQAVEIIQAHLKPQLSPQLRWAQIGD